MNPNHPAMRTTALLFATISAAAAATAPDFESALATARQTRAPIAVFIHGSDWNQAGIPLLKTWNDPRLSQSAGAATVLVAIDRKENPDASETEAAKRNAGCKPPVRSLPAVALFDSDGRFVAARSGIAEIEASGGLPGTVRQLAAVLLRRDDFWKRAAATSGPRKAALLAAGLNTMNQGLGPDRIYQPVLDEMKQADPADSTGHIAAQAFSHWDLLGRVFEKAKNNQHAEAEAELEKWLRNPALTPRQKQELHATRFALYQRWTDKKNLARKALEDMRNVDPKSDLGLAAVSYLELLTKSPS